MKLTKKIRLFCVLTACASFSAVTLAKDNTTNHVVLENSAHSTAPLTLSYIVEHNNAAGFRLPKIPLRAKTVHLKPGQTKTVGFNMDNYKLAGVVPIAVGKNTMHSGNAFNKPDQCAVTTDEHHPNGKLTFTAIQQPNAEVKVECKSSGGIFSA